VEKGEHYAFHSWPPSWARNWIWK